MGLNRIKIIVIGERNRHIFREKKLVTKVRHDSLQRLPSI